MFFGFRLDQVNGVLPEASAAGIEYSDTLESVEGHSFSGVLLLHHLLDQRRARDLLHVVVRKPNGIHLSTAIKLAPNRAEPPSLGAWITTLAIIILLPVFSLALGFWVAFGRPTDPRAWLLLGLMIGFSQFVEGFSWEWPFESLAVLWNALLGLAFGPWLIWLVFFALLFPKRSEFDRKRPWLKWILLVPLLFEWLVFATFQLGTLYSYHSIQFLRPLLAILIKFPLFTYLSAAAISAFFGLIISKSINAPPDDARRLRILINGVGISLLPLFITVIISVVRGHDVFYGIPEWAQVTSLLALLLFPITMAYVLVIQRAMGMGVVLRQGLKYALARRGFWIFRSALLGIAVWTTSIAFSDRHPSLLGRILAALFLGAVILLRRKFSDRLSQWIDRQFFRDAYSTEIVMIDLAEGTRRFTEAGPLLGTVAQRISDTLHMSNFLYQ